MYWFSRFFGGACLFAITLVILRNFCYNFFSCFSLFNFGARLIFLNRYVMNKLNFLSKFFVVFLFSSCAIRAAASEDDRLYEQRQFATAALWGDVHKLKRIWSSRNVTSFDVDWRDANGDSALSLACKCMYTSCRRESSYILSVTWLINFCGASPVALCCDENRPLHYAVKGGCIDIVRFLFTFSKYSTYLKNVSGQTSLSLAYDLVLKYPADDRYPIIYTLLSYSRGAIGLGYAVKLGRLSVIKSLVSDFDADVNLLDQRGNAVIHVAAELGRVDVVRCLVEDCGADVNLLNQRGEIGLDIARKHYNRDVVEFLSGLK